MKDASVSAEDRNEHCYPFNFSDETSNRVFEIFHGMDGTNCPTIQKSQYPGKKLFIPLYPSKKFNSKLLKFKYSNFLLSNNMLVSYNAKQSSHFLEAIKELIESNRKFKRTLAELSLSNIKSIFKLNVFDSNHKKDLLTYVDFGLNDLEKLLILFTQILTGESTQILDVYLLAEHCIFYVKGIEQGMPALENTGARTKDSLRIPGIKNFCAHKDFFVRQSYFLAKTMAVHLLGTANELRAMAGLELIFESEIGDKVFQKNYFTINSKLRPIEVQIRPLPISAKKINKGAKAGSKKVTPIIDCETKIGSESLPLLPVESGTGSLEVNEPVINDEIKTEALIEHKDEKIIEVPIFNQEEDEEQIYNYMFIPWINTVIEQQPNSIGVELNESLGESIFNMLSTKHQKNFLCLFEQRANTLSQKQLNSLIKQVAFCMISLGHVRTANELLSKAAHFYHPNEGKAGKLPAIYLEYRLIPFILSDIVPPGFNKAEIIQQSKILRRHHGFL